MSKVAVGLMGFGEIGRDVYRLSLDQPDLEIVAISDIGRPDILHYLLQSDGRHPVDTELESNYLIDSGRRARIIHGIAPSDVPWDAFGVDIVIDSTHRYRTRETLQGHLDSGAKRVILSTVPDEELDNLVITGVNGDSIGDHDRIISAGSSTTNSAALMLKVLDNAFGVQQAMITSVHAFTSDQPLRNTVGKYFRRSRSAAVNIIPNISHSPRWIEYVLPHMKGKIDGFALNVPVPLGSLLDLTVVIETTNTTVAEVNAALVTAAEANPTIIEVTDDPIVSSDVIGNTHTVVFDSQATMRSAKRMVKTLSWYDNSLAQASRLIDITKAYGQLGRK